MFLIYQKYIAGEKVVIDLDKASKSVVADVLKKVCHLWNVNHQIDFGAGEDNF